MAIADELRESYERMGPKTQEVVLREVLARRPHTGQGIFCDVRVYETIADVSEAGDERGVAYAEMLAKACRLEIDRLLEERVVARFKQQEEPIEDVRREVGEELEQLFREESGRLKLAA